MTYSQYWDCDPYLCVYYREAWKQKQLIENQNQWRQGYYNYIAFSTVLSNAFKKKGSKAEKYLEEPLQIFPKTEEELAEEERRNAQKTINTLNHMKMMWDAKHKEK